MRLLVLYHFTAYQSIQRPRPPSIARTLSPTVPLSASSKSASIDWNSKAWRGTSHESDDPCSMRIPKDVTTSGFQTENQERFVTFECTTCPVRQDSKPLVIQETAFSCAQLLSNVRIPVDQGVLATWNLSSWISKHVSKGRREIVTNRRYWTGNTKCGPGKYLHGVCCTDLPILRTMAVEIKIRRSFYIGPSTN